ncbi:hypothetical protein AAC387_Pa09g2249 [Persea americana]
MEVGSEPPSEACEGERVTGGAHRLENGRFEIDKAICDPTDGILLLERRSGTCDNKQAEEDDRHTCNTCHTITLPRRSRCTAGGRGRRGGTVFMEEWLRCQT